MRILNFSGHLGTIALPPSKVFPDMFALHALAGKVKSLRDASLVQMCSGDLDREVELARCQ